MLHIKCYVLYKLRDTLCLVYLCVYGPFRKHTIRTISIRCTIRYGLYQSEMCHTNPILVWAANSTYSDNIVEWSLTVNECECLLDALCLICWHPICFGGRMLILLILELVLYSFRMRLHHFSSKLGRVWVVKQLQLWADTVCTTSNTISINNRIKVYYSMENGW